jgi:hypothetical protein
VTSLMGGGVLLGRICRVYGYWRVNGRAASPRSPLKTDAFRDSGVQARTA